MRSILYSTLLTAALAAQDGTLSQRSAMLGEAAVPLTEAAAATADPAPLPAPWSDAVSMPELEAFLQDEKQPMGWSGTLAANGLYVTGNTERRQAGVAFDAERRAEADRITVRGRWDYAEEKNVPTVWTLSQRRTYGGLKYDYFVSKAWYVSAYTSAEGDFKANLDLRFTAGVGVGLQVVEREDLKFNVEAGLAYFFEDYRTPGPSEETVAARAAYNLNKQFDNGLRFIQFVEAFFGLDSSDDVLVKKDSRLQAKLTEAMFAELGWLLTFDNTPAPGNERVDHTFTLSVGWTF